MNKESPNLQPGPREEQEKNQKREALDVLLEVRERLLAQMAEDILSNREALIDGSEGEGISTFELEEIEDRYSTRLNTLNSLLENLEYRQPVIRHKIETLTTTTRSIKKDLASLLSKHEQWDLVDVDVSPTVDDGLLVVVALTADEYPE